MSVTYLVTPFNEKDQVKALGARWDPGRRQWYVPEGRDLAPFAAWLPADLQAAHDAVADSLPAVSPPTASSALSLSGGKGVPLSRLLAGVAQSVAQAFPEGVWTLVEVVDARLRNGHVYLEVSERDERGTVLAKSNAVIWASQAERILPGFEQATGAQVGPGIKLLVRARPVFKPQYGFSLEIDAIDAGYTLGDLEARKREIRERLQREGLFDLNKRLPAPWDFNHVLVIAPEGAAGLGDFQAEASRLQTFGVCQFTYAYSRFQGEGAAAQIRVELHSALEQIRLNHPWVPDAVAIIRGGGAVNDLAWLNDYDLARAVCELDIPLFTGIGHERDSTVLDEVAHQAFDTPSKVIGGIERVILQRVREAQSAFDEVARGARRQVEHARRVLQSTYLGIEAGAGRAVATARRDVPALFNEVRTAARQTLKDARQTSQALMREIAGQGPDKTLGRGFALVRDARGQPITSAHGPDVAGAPISIEFRDGHRQAVLGEEVST